MSDLEERTRAFYDFELQGRGWRSFSYPVFLEPVFRAFKGHGLTVAVPVDDGRRHTWLSSLVELVREAPPANHELALEEVVEPGEFRWPDALSEFEVLVPVDEKIEFPATLAWLQTAAANSGPIAFELLGTNGQVALRFCAGERDASRLSIQTSAFFPAVSVRDAERTLAEIWQGSEADVAGVIEFGLAREFMLPLKDFNAKADALTAAIAMLGCTGVDEISLLQILFEPVRAPWSEHALCAVVTPGGTPFFADAPEITSLTNEKCSEPLFATVIRIAVRAHTRDKAEEIVYGVAGALSLCGAPDRNELAPLAVEDVGTLVDDIVGRITRRSGMILSLSDLASLVHLPGEHVRVRALARPGEPQRALPTEVLRDDGLALGVGTHRGNETTVRLAPDARAQHCYVVGASGTGKSTLLEQMILQDVLAGNGVGVLDPHGDLIDDILARIPDERRDDVIVFDPSDQTAIVGWNMLGAHSDAEKDLLSSDLVAAFRRLSTSWGDQMNVVLANAVMAVLESSSGGTLIELRRFLLDSAFRDSFLRTVRDPHVVSFWREEFALLVGKKPQAPILTRLDTFLRSRLVREAVTERERPLDFRKMIDGGKIFLAKLSQGAIGQENAALLGSMLVSRFHQVSLSRQDLAQEVRRPFYLYIDEFQNVATPSMAGLFSGVRKYKLALTVAHQDLHQLHASAPEVERAVLANAYTRIVFQVSDEDARKLERGVAGFTAEDLASLNRGEAVCRVGRRDNAFRLQTQPLDSIDAVEALARRAVIRARSIELYGRKRGDVPPSAGNAPVPMPATIEVTSPSPPRPSKPSTAPEPTAGRGGAVHKYLQHLIRTWAHERGFRADIEQTLPSGGRIDIALVRDDMTIACEIAMTTSIDHEIENIKKCLEAKVTHVAVVSLDARFLQQIGTRCDEMVTLEERSRISFVAPHELFAYLETTPIPIRTDTVAGYKVTVNYKRDADADVRRKAIAEIMAKRIKRMKRTDQ